MRWRSLVRHENNQQIQTTRTRWCARASPVACRAVAGSPGSCWKHEMLMPARAVRSYFRAALTSRAGLFVRAFADISSAVALFCYSNRITAASSKRSSSLMSRARGCARSTTARTSRAPTLRLLLRRSSLSLLTLCPKVRRGQTCRIINNADLGRSK